MNKTDNARTEADRAIRKARHSEMWRSIGTAFVVLVAILAALVFGIPHWLGILGLVIAVGWFVFAFYHDVMQEGVQARAEIAELRARIVELEERLGVKRQ